MKAALGGRLLLALALFHSACTMPNPARTWRYAVPDQIDDGWPAGPLTGEGVDTTLVAALMDRVLAGRYRNLHSLLLVRNGRLLLEEYLPDSSHRDRETLQAQHSVTKSVVALLVGIAIDRGLIGGVDEPIRTFFPEHAALFQDTARAGIRLGQLLSMSAGLRWDEWKYPYTDPRNDLIMMHRSQDPVRYVLQRPLVAPPGERFAYNGGISLLLGEIIRKVSGVRADRFAERYLFAPLGISHYRWEILPGDLVNAGGGLSLRPRDMAKLGALVLNRGRWQGHQIVSDGWIDRSTRQQAPTHDRWYAWWVPFFARWIFKRTPLAHNEYGYHWWLGSFQVGGRTLQSSRAEGRGGQAVFVFPDLDLIALFTGWNDNTLGNAQPLDMLQRYLLPAVVRVR